MKYQRPSARSAEPCWKAGSSFSTVSSASLMAPRYFRPWRIPNDSASAPMLAAIQKWPSGRLGCRVDGRARRRDARLRAIGLRSASGGVSAEPVAGARQLPRRRRSPAGRAARRCCQSCSARLALARSSRFAYSASGSRVLRRHRRLDAGRQPAGRCGRHSGSGDIECEDAGNHPAAARGAGRGSRRAKGLLDTPKRVEKALHVPDQRLRRRHRRHAEQRAVHRRL